MKRSILLIGGVLALFLLLVSAAFVGAGMLRTSKGQTAENVGGRVMEVVTDDGSGPTSYRIQFAPAPELPDSPAEVGGIFIRRQDNSIFVGTGDITLDVEVNGDTGDRSMSLGHNGPEVEVVVTHDTVIFKDVTEFSVSQLAQGKSGERTVQQQLQPVDSLDEIDNNTELQVWGDRRGDRVSAEVLVYRVVEEF